MEISSWLVKQRFMWIVTLGAHRAPSNELLVNGAL